MEDTLRGVQVALFVLTVVCLNPCFNGRYSQRNYNEQFVSTFICLNPCFNGRYSQSCVGIATIVTGVVS